MKKNLVSLSGIRRMLVIAICAMVSVNVMADNEKPITVDQLPTAAQQTLKKDFPNMKVALAKLDNEIFDKSYDVIFTDGSKIEFDRKGNWTEVSCKNSVVPAAFIPTAIKDYLKGHYPTEKVISIERDIRGYEVHLSNRFELTFNKSFKLIDIDD